MINLNFSAARVLVIGDAILDRYYFGRVSRISPEAPVPIVKVARQTNTLGGACNVVHNIAHLGAASRLVGVAGRDADRTVVEALLGDIGVEHTLFDTGTPTTTKVRVIGEHQQVVRLDFEEVAPIGTPLADEIIALVNAELPGVGAIVISDYGKGVCTPELCQRIIGAARERGRFVVVDPKGRDWSKYAGASIITPNVNELSDVAGTTIPNEDGPIANCGREILERYDLASLLVTRSDRGMSLVTREGVTHIPTEALEVFDVSGAGDTVVATLAVSVASGLDLAKAVTIANRAAGVVVGKFGTAPIEFEELVHFVSGRIESKVVAHAMLPSIISRLHFKGKRVVMAFGPFSAMDLATITTLKKARAIGDVLIVGIEESAAPDDAAARAELVASIEHVDFVTIARAERIGEMLGREPVDAIAVSAHSPLLDEAPASIPRMTV
ncbi:MAG TPA: D-glycero-beta-D-manno-heptose-7-phosphate kinase [Spirochaetota bacterium]|nr:D-glycero-beta-D-manno-heptose-7-phosphate kinase [Spirochaetota bacterium]HNT12595.1 D-glycero-beta-D-manno-heptose-7-phosphate kinase [Spirochaetota bacterium]